MVKTLGFNTQWFPESSVSDILEYFEEKEFVEFDSETTGFDCYVNELVCFQLGDNENQFVISPEYLQSFKELLLKKTLIGHNIKFDLKFLYRHNIFPDNVYDTMLAEAILYCGIKAHKKALDYVADRYLGVKLDKSIRAGIGKHQMTKEEIQYSANDVKYLGKIREKQLIKITEENLQVTLRLENNFVLVLAYIEFCGMYLDVEIWKAKMVEDEEFIKKTKSQLDDFILENNFFEYISIQGDLFEGSRKVNINWDSPKQVAKLFKQLHIPVDIIEKGVEKESVGAKSIARYKDKFPLVGTYLTYKEQMKTIGSYGQNFLDQINPVTGRLHTNFYQIQDTGRISSGGKNKQTGEEYLNFQNITSEDSDKDAGKSIITRHCFVAEEGNILIDSDYAGQETVILANQSMDRNLLKFFDDNLGDLHAFTASNMYPELKGMDLKKIKKEHKDKRQKAKSAGFAVAYGGNETTIATNENIPIEDAKNIYDGYFLAFPDLKQYFAKVSQQGIDKGYILIDNVTKRKHYIQFYDKFLEEKRAINRDFWDKWKLIKPLGKGNPQYDMMKERMSHYFKVKGSIERKGLNYPVQGCAASITKISGIYIFNWIKENNYLNVVKMVNQIHDENLVECPNEIGETVRRMVEDSMIKAGKPFCKRIPLIAEAVINSVWGH